jgi:hypothetical protein
MTNPRYNHVAIQKLFNAGYLHEGIAMAKRFIAKHGKENSQIEILLLAKGLFAAGFCHEAQFWIKKTTADPITRIPLEEKIENKICHLT